MRNERNAEFRFLEIPNGEDILTVLGCKGIKKYGVYEDGEKSDKLHFHNLMEVAICRRGTGEVNLDKKWYPYRSGDILVIPQNTPHAINSYGKESFWEYVYVKPSIFLEKIFQSDIRRQKRYEEKVEFRAFIVNKDRNPDLEAEINLIMNQNRIKAYGYKDCIKGLVFALLMEIVKINHIEQEKPENKERQNIQKVEVLALAFAYVEENYAKELRISDIANAAYVSERYLRRLFMTHCAISPMQYVNKIRIEAACKMMENTDTCLNNIAYSVGFENMGTFISNFKKMKGCTPKQWKQKILRKME